MVKIIQEILGSWLYLVNEDAVENKKLLEEQEGLEDHGSLGKYLFFSDSQATLIQLALYLLDKYDLNIAKISIEENSNKGEGYSFVCCVYDSWPKLVDELGVYADERSIRYRRWKSDAATLAGEYSKFHAMP